MFENEYEPLELEYIDACFAARVTLTFPLTHERRTVRNFVRNLLRSQFESWCKAYADQPLSGIRESFMRELRERGRNGYTLVFILEPLELNHSREREPLEFEKLYRELWGRLLDVTKILELADGATLKDVDPTSYPSVTALVRYLSSLRHPLPPLSSRMATADPTATSLARESE